jgi:hypothetical protein
MQETAVADAMQHLLPDRDAVSLCMAGMGVMR